MLKDTTRRRRLLLITKRRSTDQLAHAFARYGALLPQSLLLGYAGGRRRPTR
jgi:hypothetical protein